jgi:hypothetical protein
VKAFLLTLLVLVESYFLGDAAFLWLLFNFGLLWPLAHSKKGKEIDGFIGMINAKIDKAVGSVSFLKRQSQQVSG